MNNMHGTATATQTSSDLEESAPTGMWVRRLNYLYFVRFSIVLWLSMPALALLDGTVGESATRGIVALGDWWQLFFAAFFVAVNGWIALLSARIVCAYGKERFTTDPPPRLAVDKGKDMRLRTFWLAQLPGFGLLGYVAFRSHEQEFLSYPYIILAFVCGVAVALLCWSLMAGIYYWMFCTEDPLKKAQPTTESPRAFMVPYARCFRRLQTREPSTWLLVLIYILGKILARGPGYRHADRPFNQLHDGHALSFLALGFILTIYGVFWDITSPFPVKTVHSVVTWAIPLVAGLWTLAAAIYWFRVLRKRKEGWKRRLSNIALMVVLFLPMLVVSVLPFTGAHSEVMPVLASVSVLLLFVIWFLSALAFWLDRFRVPVTVFVLLFGFLISSFTGSGSGILPLPSDHSVQLAHPKLSETPEIYEPKDKQKDPNCKSGNGRCGYRYVEHLLTPEQMYDSFEQGKMPWPKGPRPVIVVTATGGGIHAAAWTNHVLVSLETEFAKQKDLPPFHSSILLISTVSGGSVGTIPWAAEYLKPDGGFSNESLESMPRVAECSGLQAVAWGLTYADFMRLVYPYRHFLFSQDLDTYDRGWALQKSFWRNRHYKPCHTETLSVNSSEETLGDLEDLAWKTKNVPAFAFNTTVAETGNRFLSANYMVPRQDDPNSEITPADSFLRVYQKDLPLSSAARLSANFPYVSPMPRVPIRGSHYHFGDGGYFDNDGTATAMEFLWYALKRPGASPGGGGSGRQPAHQAIGKKGYPRVPVLLVEIRDGKDLVASKWQDDLDAQAKGKDWSMPGQLSGPLLTFWNADHVSVTKRNRRELCFLEEALSAKAEITHIVFPYNGDPDEKQPLSWHLTKKQKDDIFNALAHPDIVKSAQETVNWYRQAQAGKSYAPAARQGAEADHPVTSINKGCPL